MARGKGQSARSKKWNAEERVLEFQILGFVFIPLPLAGVRGGIEARIPLCFFGGSVNFQSLDEELRADANGFASKVEFNRFRVIRVIRVIRGSSVCGLKTGPRITRNTRNNTKRPVV
jgi:hypothetical protein